MPPPRKRPRELEAEVCTLPSDLLLEIIARSDVVTLVRFASSCKPLRRDILAPAFIRRVSHGSIIPCRLLGFFSLNLNYSVRTAPWQPPSFSLAHPSTPAAASLSDDHITPFLTIADDASRLACRAYNLVTPLTSRHGLAVFLGGMGMYHRGIEIELCVYDPMVTDTTKQCRFLPGPPPAISQIRGHAYFYDKFVLLTPADDVTSGCSFLLHAFDFTRLNESSRSVMVRTFSSDGSAWSPATLVNQSPPPDRRFSNHPNGSAVVVSGGFIYWLMYETRGKGYCIFTYNVVMAKGEWIELPSEVISASKGSYHKLHLTSSSPSTNGRLCLIEAHRLRSPFGFCYCRCPGEELRPVGNGNSTR
ncbi:hypothetical protein QOZ80_5BG0447230 [Eleusine coracana subsp. coracana]|nr:hypothetical protein QOZ80_5BG0447230 [Eleusine coracana subsp. coracana]